MMNMLLPLLTVALAAVHAAVIDAFQQSADLLGGDFSRKATRERNQASFTTSTSSRNYQLATELLGLVKETNNKKDNSQIQPLIREIIKDPELNFFKPDECIYGPLYCTLYSFTPGKPDAPPPLWERISLNNQNLKGQQYSGSDGSGSVINYSEIWGENFSLRAVGTFVRALSGSGDDAPSRDGGTDTGNSRFAGRWLSNPFQKEKKTSISSSTKGNDWRACPDDYNVTVTGASLSLFRNKLFDLPISGESVLRVLYADPRLRIFVSPKASDSLAGEWENAGLIVVQCRSDLVDSQQGQPIDLRP